MNPNRSHRSAGLCGLPLSLRTCLCLAFLHAFCAAVHIYPYFVLPPRPAYPFSYLFGLSHTYVRFPTQSHSSEFGCLVCLLATCMVRCLQETQKRQVRTSPTPCDLSFLLPMCRPQRFVVLNTRLKRSSYLWLAVL